MKKKVVFVLVTTTVCAIIFHWISNERVQTIKSGSEVVTEASKEEAYEFLEEFDKAAEGEGIHFVRTIDCDGYEQAISAIEKAINEYNKGAKYEAKIQMQVNKLDSCVQLEFTSNGIVDMDFPVNELGQTALLLPGTIIWEDVGGNIKEIILQVQKIGPVRITGVAYLSKEYVEIHMLDDKDVTKIDKEGDYKLFINYGETQGWVLPDQLTRNGVLD